MRRNWQTIPLVVVVGALAGAAIAGRPTTPANDVVISPDAVTTTSTTTTTLPPVTTPAVVVTTDAPATTDEAPATTDDEDASATTDDESTDTSDAATTTTQRPTSTTSTSTSTSTPATTTSTSTTTTTTTTAAKSDEAAPDSARSEIEVLVANGTNRAGLARRTADQLRLLGYELIVADDADRNFALSVVYADSVNRAAALRVAEDLGIPAAFVLTPGVEPVTNNDARGTVVVALGEDQL